MGRPCLKPIRVCLTLTFAFLFFCIVFSSPTNSQTQTGHKPPIHHLPFTLEGNWSGSLQAGDTVLHLVLHVSKTEDGSFKATIDSLDQGVTASK